MKYVCTTCDLALDGIPDGAIEIGCRRGRGYRVNTYRFKDGSTHSLRQLKVTIKQHQHLHKMSKKIWCDFCFPPPTEQPVEQTQVVQAPVPEPRNMAEEEPVESQLSSITILSAAFGRVSKKNSR